MIFSKYPEIEYDNLILKMSGLIINRNIKNIQEFVHEYLNSDKNLYFIIFSDKYFKATSFIYDKESREFFENYDIRERNTNFNIMKMTKFNKMIIKENIYQNIDIFLDPIKSNEINKNYILNYYLDEINHPIGEFHLKSLLEDCKNKNNKLIIRNINYTNTEYY